MHVKWTNWNELTFLSLAGIQFINTLSLFLLVPEERERGTIVHGTRGYIPDLILQGVLFTGSNSSIICDEDIIQSMWPSTVIDIDQLTVKQTHHFHE